MMTSTATIGQVQGGTHEPAIPELATQARSEPPGWSAARLDSTPKHKYLHLKQFVSCRQRSHHGVVAFKNIDRFISSVGDVRVDWSGLFGICEKKMVGEEHLWNAEYWMDASRKEGLSFVIVDQSLLVSRGLYKTVLARYALHYKDSDTLYGVKVSRWMVDWEMYRFWWLLNRICAEKYPHYRLIPEKKRLSETREGHWCSEYFLLTLRRTDRNTGETRILGAKDVANWAEELGVDVQSEEFALEQLRYHALAE